MNNEDQEVKHCGILVVDDDEDYISFVKDALPGFGFKNLFFANNGYDCINILAEKKELIYLVLLDIRMPNMSGIQVIEHLMNVHKFIVGIIVVTGYRSPAEKNYCFALNSPNIIIANWFEKPGKFLKDNLAIRAPTNSSPLPRRKWHGRTNAKNHKRIY